MKPLGWVVTVLVILGVGTLWLRAHDKAVRATAELVRRDSVLAAMADSLEISERKRLTLRQATNDSLVSLHATIVRDSTLADSLRAAGVARYVELRGALPSTERPLLDSLMQNHALEVAAKDSQIVALTNVSEILRGELTRADSALAYYRNTLNLAITQRDGWKAKASRRTWVACGPGAGATLKGAGVGVGCVLNLL